MAGDPQAFIAAPSGVVYQRASSGRWYRISLANDGERTPVAHGPTLRVLNLAAEDGPVAATIIGARRNPLDMETWNRLTNRALGRVR